MQKLVIGGLYKHYKGNIYKVLGVVRHSETLEEMVHYLRLENGTAWVRPKEMFLETIKKDGTEVERFKLVDPEPEAKIEPHRT